MTNSAIVSQSATDERFTTSFSLASLLDKELQYSPQAQRGFVNHLPMTLVAAARLGASDARLQEIYDSHVSEGYLVERKRPEWLDEHVVALVRQGLMGAVSDRVSALVSAVDARWFHALIRLELALDVRHLGQIANALKDWEEVARHLPALPATRGNFSLVDLVRELHSEGDFARFRRLQLREVAAHPQVQACLGRARLGEHALEDAAELALQAHIASHNFSTLHLITGARAARAVAQLLPERAAVTLGEHLAQAVFAGCLAGSESSLPSSSNAKELRLRRLPDWTEIAEKAVSSDDTHVIKLTYACQLEQQSTGNVLYQWVAARETGLLGDAHGVQGPS